MIENAIERQQLAHKISKDTATMLSDYFKAKVVRLQDRVNPGFVYMAMLGGAVATITSVIEAVAKNNPDLAQALREDIAKKVTEAGTNG